MAVHASESSSRARTNKESCIAGQAAVVVGHSSNCLGGWIHLVPLHGELIKFKLQRNSLQFEKASDPVSCCFYTAFNVMLALGLMETQSTRPSSCIPTAFMVMLPLM